VKNLGNLQTGHTVVRRQHPGFLGKFGKFDAATPRPSALDSGDRDIGFIQQPFGNQIVFAKRPGQPADQQFDIARAIDRIA
jgi:hypothetical protein